MSMCGSVFDPTASTLSGLDPTVLQLWRSKAQTALLELSLGAKVATASYSQGDGAQSVSYTQADQGRLQALIMLIDSQLGTRRRAPVRFMYR